MSLEAQIWTSLLEGLGGSVYPDIVDWAEEDFYITETQQPIILEPHQKRILRHCFTADESGKFPYTTVVYSAPKKSGKTTVGALVGIYIAESQEPFNEIICVANDYEQAASRIFGQMKKSLEMCPRGKKRYKVPEKLAYLTYYEKHTVIKAISSDYKGEAGANPGLTLWSELWAYETENARRLYDELTPVPTRKNSIRFIETYAGFEGESTLLKEIYDDVVKPENLIPELAPLPCYRDGSRFVYWDHEARMPWQTPEYYASQQKECSTPEAFRRLHKNEWIPREGKFIPIIKWDETLDPEHHSWKEGGVGVVLGADASMSRDSTALVGCSYDPTTDRVLLQYHKIWEPQPSDMFAGRKIIDLDETIKEEILDLQRRGMNILAVYYDPYQLHSIAVSLLKKGFNMIELPQTDARIKADTNLFDVISTGRLVTYPQSRDLREHINNAIALQRPRGLRLAKEKTKKKIDGAVALSMAAHGAMVMGGGIKRSYQAVGVMF